MITDEEHLYLFMLYGGGKPVLQSPSRPVFRNNRTAGGRNMWVSEPRKRTKAEAKERLPHLPQPVRRLGRRAPPAPYMIPFYALELADILIEIDPLDRLED